MSQVRIYGHRHQLEEHRTELSNCIHSCLVEAIRLPESKRFQRFLPLDDVDFIHPPDRTNDYIIIEISMFTGRSIETRKRLIRLLFERIEVQVGIAPHDVEITIIESPAENWGIRGRCGDELSLGYDVEV